MNRDGSGGYTGKWYGYCDGKQFDSSNNRYSPESCDQSRWTLPDEADNGLLHIPGVLAMAKTSSPNTGSSQFYIVPEDSTPNHLDGVHTVFGMVVSGLDHVTAFSAVAATLNNLGPGLGDVAHGFMSMPENTKWIAITGMLLGRLEIFTLLVLFTPTFWRH